MEALTWEAVAAIVGSVVTITVGVFGYLVKTADRKPAPAPVDTVTKINLATIERIQVKLAAVKEKAVAVEGSINLVNQQLESVQQHLAEHEARDVRDFDSISKKLDKLTDVIMKILTDDKL